MNRLAALISLFLFCGSSFAFTVPRHLSQGKSNFTWHSFYDACFSMETFMDSLPCNPAYLLKANDRNQKNYAHAFAGSNDIQYLRDVEAIVNGRGDRETIERILGQVQSTELEADVELGSLKETWAWSLSPSRISYYSLVRNRPLPFVSLYASQEQILRFQFAKDFQNNITGGIQLRGMHRRLILSEFFLTEALVENGAAQVLKNHTQDILYVEPGMLWALPDQAWQPQVALAVTQLGLVDRRYEGLSSEPEGQAGISLKPPVAEGSLEIGFHTAIHNQYEDLHELLRVAGSYNWEFAQIAGSFNEAKQDLGLMLRWEPVRLGVLFEHHRFENILGRSDQEDRFFFEFGLEN